MIITFLVIYQTTYALQNYKIQLAGYLTLSTTIQYLFGTERHGSDLYDTLNTYMHGESCVEDEVGAQ